MTIYILNDLIKLLGTQLKLLELLRPSRIGQLNYSILKSCLLSVTRQECRGKCININYLESRTKKDSFHLQFEGKVVCIDHRDVIHALIHCLVFGQEAYTKFKFFLLTILIYTVILDGKCCKLEMEGLTFAEVSLKTLLLQQVVIIMCYLGTRQSGCV